ncbi:Arm DNA-binding domain-containing protein [Bradyrhizobium mercantei]|uniref:Arm DNA-binding domain-containing protein n=1 Tax=Bradyrhizobium mercantei TaxID=1904807 RepID=UPI001FD90526|nr:Arm DNA-binding domain-containing protein [Bradyrhizobium mercantei]
MAGKLRPLDVERETKPGKYADGDGLYLIVTGPAAKSWSYRYWKDGKERWHGLGSFKEVSLKNARLATISAVMVRELNAQGLGATEIAGWE